MLSVLDLFRVGIGPSSSHTVGPIRIANRFASGLGTKPVARIEVELQGSLALTGVGHATPKAIVLGLLGFEPETLDPDDADARVASVYASKRIRLAGHGEIAFDPSTDIVFAYHIRPVLHPNGIRAKAYDAAGGVLADETWYSTGGGFIATERQLSRPAENDLIAVAGVSVPHPFASAADLLAACAAGGVAMHDIILRNEDTRRARAETEAALSRIADVMLGCIARGLVKEGTLPGGLKVRRRAPALRKRPFQTSASRFLTG
jgi:L-serine dehydratase